MENGHYTEKELARQISSYLARTGKKQYELAAEIGAPVQTVNRWLNGKAKVSRAYQVILKSKGVLP
jgi:plasmid maintenance system antidote protein VapI